MTFDLSEVSTAYEPSYEPSHEPQDGLTPLSGKGTLAPSLFSQQHKRQQSAPVFSIPRLQSRSPSLSPTRSSYGRPSSSSQDMALTGDGRAGVGGNVGGSGGSGGNSNINRPQNTAGRFAGWFNGSSTPSIDERNTTTPKSTRAGSTYELTPKSATHPPRLGFFASLTNRLASNQNTLSPQELDDEICNMDIDAALYPGPSISRAASPAPSVASGNTDRGGGGDAFSPAAYKNLQANATGLLLKIQGAYRERATELREARAERDAQAEEAEEARLRVELFKTQLEDMARRATEHEEEMRRLVAELDGERAARRRLEEERVVAAAAAEKCAPSEEEDLGVNAETEANRDNEDDPDRARRRTWRSSRGTVKSDLSVETMTTDGDSSESVHSSVFSRSRSRSPSRTIMTTNTAYDGESTTTSTTTTATAGTGTPHHKTARSPAPSSPAPTPTLSPAAALAPPPPRRQPQLSTFQRLVKGISGSENGGGPSSCRNCSGRDSSVAWDTVSLLRDENKGLKHRVAALEVAVEGALDVVNGIELR